MRKLSYSQANNCENAIGKVCRCRCGGALHGIARGEGEAFFKNLPEEDAHSRQGVGEKKKRLSFGDEFEERAKRHLEWKRKHNTAVSVL